MLTQALKQRVKEATETQSAFSDGRPPLVILDEIDGAMGGSEGQGAINEVRSRSRSDCMLTSPNTHSFVKGRANRRWSYVGVLLFLRSVWSRAANQVDQRKEE